MASFGLVLPSQGMSLYQDGLAHRVRLTPNNPSNFQLGLWYEGLGASFGFGSGKLRKDIELETRVFDLQMFLTFPRFATDVYWQRYEGYASDDEEHGEIAALPEATMGTHGLNVYHKLVGNVDLVALRTPHQDRRFLSYLVYAMGSLSHRRFEAPNGFVPAGQVENYPEQADFALVDQSNASVSVGLLLPIHLWLFHFDPAMSLGFGLPVDHVEGRIGERAGIKLNMKLRSGIAGAAGGVALNVDADSDAMETPEGNTFAFHSIRVGIEGSRRF